ncbi:MFS transporter [Erythrobacter dokdonensis]|uniref:Major facilitator superfamily permease n=1 Tax=Erythrobacter dokdonensis DSW-74 TaxID=1300349 RepID=A0A1A7BGN9_9SPHN|nr:MFS transporter [Erythrobacter dokdonensis]OBV10587.1 Major facilitator superfamily permease [Erythrobacter dokdonensis DSW-74]
MEADHDQPSLGMVLAESSGLRLFTLVLFYFNQGIAPGIFLFAIPAWLASHDVPTAGIAVVVSAAGLPWTLKFLLGFLIDRYPYLPMGRRRAWIIAAQGTLVAVMIAGALANPQPAEIVLLAGLAFLANIAVNFQDVGIDALAIDLMAEEERTGAAAMMVGAQVIGLSISVATFGWALEHAGTPAAMLAAAAVPLVTMIYGCVLVERRGERRLPWSKGTAHPGNRAIQVAAWRPLLRETFRALRGPFSLAFVPLLLVRSLPSGVHETYLPALFARAAGWTLSDYTSLMAMLTTASGAYCILAGGRIVSLFGERRVLAGCAAILAVWASLFAALPSLWNQTSILIGYAVVAEFLIMTFTIALVPVAMRLCVPGAAASQFVVYMGLSGVGRPFGALLAGAASGMGVPEVMFWVMSACLAAAGFYAAIFKLAVERAAQPEYRGARFEAPGNNAVP